MRIRRRSDQGPLRFQAFGVGLSIQLASNELRQYAELLLPPEHQPCEAEDVDTEMALLGSENEGYTVTAAGEVILEHGDLEIVLNALDAQIRMVIAINAKDFIFVHAGVVAIDGITVVIPGQSFTGKTTLVSEFVRAGATYFSDEYAVLDYDGHVHPYARRLSIREPAGVRNERAVHEFGGTAATTSAKLGAVILTRYSPDATWEPQPVTPGVAALALLSNALPARDRPADTLKTLTRAVAGVPVLLQSDRGEAALAASAVIAQLSGAR